MDVRKQGERQPAVDPALAPKTGAPAETSAPKKSAAAESKPVDTFEASEKAEQRTPVAPQKVGVRDQIRQLWQSFLEALGIRKPALTGLQALHATLDKTNNDDLYTDYDGSPSDGLLALQEALKKSPLLTSSDFSLLAKDPYGKGLAARKRNEALQSLYKTPEGEALKKLVNLVKDNPNRDSLVIELGPLLDPENDNKTNRGTDLLSRLVDPRFF